ncbi:DUF4232 domain-containing protein [Streptomyces sp. NPDC048002]|uniref:DUF4232 domain-containing protein n=1 Tax=Streptomyces sp. NPDC048002 TaxID=3154344 RepID=UPI003404E1CD
MRATALPLATTFAAALAAALLLTSCGDSGDDGAGGAGGDEGQKSGGAGAAAACVIADMEVQVGPANAAPAAGDTGNVPVTLTNEGAACVLDGLPTVALKADGTSSDVAADEAATARKQTLAEGGTTSFTLTYVLGEAGGAQSLAVKTAEFGLPGAEGTHAFPWSYGEVALKGEQPDATVSGFQQGD